MRYVRWLQRRIDQSSRSEEGSWAEGREGYQRSTRRVMLLPLLSRSWSWCAVVKGKEEERGDGRRTGRGGGKYYLDEAKKEGGEEESCNP